MAIPDVRFLINHSPRLEIEFNRNMTRLSIILDSDDLPVNKRIADLMIAPEEDFRYLAWHQNKIEVRGFVNIAQESKSLSEKYPEARKYSYAELQAQGLVHTIQIPLLALKKAGYINEAQFEHINIFVKRHSQPFL